MRKSIVVLLALVALVGAGAFAGAALLQDKQDMKDMMQKPGPEHDVLKRFEGTWDCTAHCMGMDGKTPTTSKMTSTSKMTLGGMWLNCDVSGDMMGMKFEGRSVTGYDQRQKKYVEFWVDSMNSGTNLDTGDWNEATKTLTIHGKNCHDGSPMTRVTKFTDADHYVMTFNGKGPDGKEGEMMRIEATRRNAGR